MGPKHYLSVPELDHRKKYKSPYKCISCIWLNFINALLKTKHTHTDIRNVYPHLKSFSTDLEKERLGGRAGV